MSNDMRNQHGALSWGELMTNDPDAAAAFYQEVLGWQAEKMPMPDPSMGEYTVFKNPSGKEVAGAMKFPENMPAGVPDGMPPHWGLYITVDDVDATVEKAVAKGGTVVCPAMDCPGVGRMAHFQDPQGAHIAVITYEKPIE